MIVDDKNVSMICFWRNLIVLCYSTHSISCSSGASALIYNATYIYISGNSAVELLSWNTALIRSHKSTSFAGFFKALPVKLFIRTLVWRALFLSPYTQSRSSLYAEYASCVGPRNTRGPLALKDDFILVSILNLASGYENMNDNLL